MQKASKARKRVSILLGIAFYDLPYETFTYPQVMKTLAYIAPQNTGFSFYISSFDPSLMKVTVFGMSSWLMFIFPYGSPLILAPFS
jgi:hypothetical protein